MVSMVNVFIAPAYLPSLTPTRMFFPTRGHLFTDRDWKGPGFLELHRENIGAILMGMESTDDGELESAKVVKNRVDMTDITSKHSNDCNILMGEFGKKQKTKKSPESANAKKEPKRSSADAESGAEIGTNGE